MLKKTLIVGGGTALLLGLVFGRDMVSYVGTSVSWVQDSLKSQVPVEFQIERAKDMIENLKPEVKKNMHVIAKETVEVEQLQKQIAKLEDSQSVAKAHLGDLTNFLESGESSFYRCGHSYTPNEVRVDLAQKFERVKTNDDTLTNLKKMLRAREASVEAARQKLSSMLAQQRQLTVEVENLQAQHKMLEVAKTTTDVDFDDSHLARTKGLIRDIQTKLEVEERLVHADIHFQDEIPMEETIYLDIEQQVTAYLSGDNVPNAEALAANGSN